MDDALARALAVLGDRWSLAVIAALLEGPLRYGELQERLTGIAPNVLSARLKRLEEEGLVSARPYSDRPPRSRYQLTSAGQGLEAAVDALAAWGARRGAADGGAPYTDPEDLLFA